MSTPLEIAIESARAAGQVLARKFRLPREVQSKGWRDIVTDADFAAQAVVLERLQHHFPRHIILSEEGRHDIDLDAPRPTWVLDPLDGTTNYARQFPSFCVSVAMIHKRQIQVGAIYDPLQRHLFYATRGHGAFLQIGRGRPKPLHVSALTDLSGAVIGVDWARDPTLRQRTVDALSRVSAQCRSVRTTGSAALALAYVAAGWLDGYFHLSLKPWDVAVAALLILEAGGKLTQPTGRPWWLTDAPVVASNGALHEALLDALAL
jgi:myo-inositol-1(or 4)-monophosphatase